MTLHDLAKMRENYTLAGLDESDLAGSWLAQFERWLGQAVERRTHRAERDGAVDGHPRRGAVRPHRAGQGRRCRRRGLLHQLHLGQEPRPRGQPATPQRLSRGTSCSGRSTSGGGCTGWTRPPRSRTGGSDPGPRRSVPGAARSPRWSAAGPNSTGCSSTSRTSSAAVTTDCRQRYRCLRTGAVGASNRVTVEFWQGRAGRMHDRLRYRLISDHAVDDRWVVERLAP